MRHTFVVAVVSGSLALAACGDSHPTAPQLPLVPAGSAADIFPSRADFEAALQRVGNGRGTAFSGAYSVTFRHVRFTSDCRVSFVREHDFYVDTGAPDAELQRILAQGYPDYPVTLTVAQADGRVTLDADGDGVETTLAGGIDADGGFEAVAGEYLSSRSYGVARHAGRIQGSRIEGTFAAQLKLLDDPRAPGSCRLDATFDGERR